MRSTLILSWSLLAVAGSAHAQQYYAGQRATPTARLIVSAPVAPAVLAPVVVQRTQSPPLQLSHLRLDADLDHRAPADAWDRQDAAYVHWRNGSNAMDDGDFRGASEQFHRIHEAFPKSTYAAESWYWEAFSLYRSGGSRSNLLRAVAHLDVQQSMYPRTPTASDGLVLATRLRGELAKIGDDQSLRELVAILESSNECSRSGVNVKIAALNAYRQIYPQIAVHYLRELFERSAPCSSYLRQQAVFILAQVQSPESADLLLNLASNSRDPDVRVEAVQWIADIRDDRAIDVLSEILLGQASDRLKTTALFSLSQLASAGDAGIFRAIAASRYTSSQVRTQAVLWLAEQRLPDHTDWLLTLYRNERNPAIKQAVVTAIARQRNLMDRAWLINVGRDTLATLAVRKQAITAAADLFVAPADLYALYHQVELVPLREQIIELLARNQDKTAVERLIDIAVMDADSTLRTSSVRWLRQSKDPKAVEFLIAYRER